MTMLADRKRARSEEEHQQRAPRVQPRHPDEKPKKDTIEQEPWFPQVSCVPWEEACTIEDCPWDFTGCTTVQEALGRIWVEPVRRELRRTYEHLKSSVEGLRVSRVYWPVNEEVHHAVIYSLPTGAMIFGGAPLGLPSVELTGMSEDVDEHPDTGLRRRRDGSKGSKGGRSVQRSLEEKPEMPVPCLAPFHRVHDGFGVLISARHLPLLLASPEDMVQGSCYYVYPARAMETVSVEHRHLVSFARVDKSCTVYADAFSDHPQVVYVETNGNVVEDDEDPLSFATATVANVSSTPNCSPWSHEAKHL